ncbi:MAG: ATP-binding protein, partial [Deltaproteobacteria bacterium]
GTGLGLMVTQKIMEEHGGSISFRSAPGKGSTFTVVFPPRTPEAPDSGE